MDRPNHSYWHLIGKDVTRVLLSCLTSRRLLKSINYAFISLILKVKIPKWVTKFKLISAYTILYKILAKLIANRLYLVLLIPYFFWLFGFDRISVLESVWIELILLKLKIENWKHCSKIIFKCVNSTMRPIFNEKVVKKWDLWVSCTVHRTYWCAENGWKVK